uniref:Uncharacterized protein n=1 Tax=Wuchereria bancrofti TaxID=6293 RepID=A0AAF5RWI2_WUCBA
MIDWKPMVHYWAMGASWMDEVVGSDQWVGEL